MSKWQPPEGNSTQHPKTYIFVLPSLFLLLLMAPPSSLASPPALLSLLIPWAQEQQQQQPAEMGAWRQAALEALGEAPFAYTPGDERRLLKATLESGRLAERTRDEGGSWGGASAADWESPRDPDLFLLTEVAAASKGVRGGRRRQQEEAEGDGGGDEDRTTDVDEIAARRVKRTGGLSVGGSRIRTSVGGGVLGSVGGGRGGIGGLGSTRGMGGAVGGGISGGPSLSIVNPLDVLRQRLLLEIARRRMRQSEDQILANRELLKSIGKREAVETDMSAPEATGAPQSESTTKKPMSM